MIKFIVSNQTLHIATPILVADTHNYQSAEAVFRGEEWAPCTKWAHFIKNGVSYDVPFHNDTIAPEQGLDLTAGTWAVYITGHSYDSSRDEIVRRITTSTVYFKVESAENYNPFPTVTPTFAETLVGEVGNALDVANGVRLDALAGAFDGATFTPAVSADGVLSWSNDKGRENPQPMSIRGTVGRDGKDFVIKGYFSSFEELMTAITAPEAGDAYGVGELAPFEVFVFDGIHEQWVNNGPVQGAQGDPGESASIAVGSVTALPYGSEPVFQNVGTTLNAVFNVGIPQGKTPVKGVDYWTAADKQAIGEDITPALIGAIPEPAARGQNQFLKWNGTAWVTDQVAAGVASVDGESGNVVTRLPFINISVPTSAWVQQTNPTCPGFPYAASVALSGAAPGFVPQIIFSCADAISGNFAPTAKVYSGGVYIYAASIPTTALNIPSVLLVKGSAGSTDGCTNSAAMGAVSESYSVTLAASAWAQKTGFAELTATVTGLKTTDKIIIDCEMAGITSIATLTAITEAYAGFLKAQCTQNGKLYIAALEKPEVDIPLRVLAIRK